MHTLVINCGSSSIKYGLYDTALEEVDFGRVERLLSADRGHGHRRAIAGILEKYADSDVGRVGHRIAHGGSEYTDSALIDQAVLDAIAARIPDAPLHNPYSLAAIEALREARPDLPQVAVFDTAFHATMPDTYREYAIDHEVAAREGIRRFGFHGISHQYASGEAARVLGRDIGKLKLVTLHLGNGASACAVEYGRSVDTSMGNTPLEGLVMGTRSGDVDAGVLLTLMRDGYGVDALEKLLINESGLKGLSGVGADLRDIEKAAAEGNDRAQLAIDVFAHRARKYIGAYAATMGGLDGVVFTGGIGEHSHIMRRRIVRDLEFLGVRINEDANRHLKLEKNTPALIHDLRSGVGIVVVAANEELMIARDAQRITDALGETAGGTAAPVSAPGTTEQTTTDDKTTPDGPRTVSSGATVRPASADVVSLHDDNDAPRRPQGTIGEIPIAVSARHCHLTEATFKALFGADASPTPMRELSQPGQFACEEQVTVVGPENRIERVRLLGPLRTVDQIEVSHTDGLLLGIDAPVRDSGDVAGSAAVTLEGPAGRVELDEGLILARRHIHMTPTDAGHFDVVDHDDVAVHIVGGDRDLIFGDVLVRVSDSYRLEMHIDTDEANAAGIKSSAVGGLSPTDVDDDIVQHPVSGFGGDLEL